MENPTNSDIYRKLENVEHMQGAQQKTIEDHESRLRVQENFKIAYEAAAKALEGVPSRNVNKLNQDFVNIVLKFIGLLTTLAAIAYLLIQELAAKQ